MIQRIQSLFLLVGAALLGLFLFLYNFPQGAAVVNPDGGVAVNDLAWFPTLMYIFTIFLALGVLGAIFLFNNRSAQRKVVVALQYAILIFVIALLLVPYLVEGMVTVQEAGSAALFLLPLGAYLLLFLARRRIDQDIKQVKDLNEFRLR